MARRRLDTLLTERGLFPSRSRAAASVMAGQVRVGGPHGRRASKPGELVEDGEEIALEERPGYVSRGGVKLANALDSSGVSVVGRRAVDVGASTGGFTDCLLQRGAREVIAIDVGYGLLDYGLRRDGRVRVLDRTNARGLTPALLQGALGDGEAPAELPSLATVDVSFISLRTVLGPVIGCLQEAFDVLALVKPQFEVGRGRVGKGGVVRDPDLRRSTLLEVGAFAVALGAQVRGYYSSGLPGPKGNRETFIWLVGAREGGGQGAPELERMAREVEP